MRSISFKLTLAFLIVALLSVVLVAVVVGGLARREFGRFVANRDQLELVERAADTNKTPPQGMCLCGLRGEHCGPPIFFFPRETFLLMDSNDMPMNSEGGNP